MKPKINILEEIDGKMQAVTREMTPEEYAEYLAMIEKETCGE